MGDLGGTYDNDPVFFHVGIGNRRLNVAVLDDRGAETFAEYGICLRECIVHMSDLVVALCKNIVRMFFVNRRNGSLHGIPGMKHRGIFFVLCPDQF